MPVKTYDSKQKNMKADRIFIPEILLAPLFAFQQELQTVGFLHILMNKEGFILSFMA